MMKEAYIPSVNQQDLKEECANTIMEFGHIFKVLRKLHEEFGLYYPEECHTNYRDSWFHYRKLYNKKDITSMLNEKYGLEEHLLRAAKDAQINFLQQLGQWLEVWYHQTEILQDYDTDGVDRRLFEKMEMNWVKSLWEVSGEDEMIFSKACVYWYKENIYSDELNAQIQNLIHSVKNLILELRLGGVNIFRPVDNVIYVKRSIAVYEKIIKSLQESGLIYLLPSTTLICKNNIILKEEKMAVKE